jgi:flagellar biosynthesis chaperone FliJ
MALADTHRTDLSLHEANMALSQSALNAVWAKREALDQVLAQKQKSAATAEQRRDTKRHDELATQCWFRGQVK